MSKIIITLLKIVKNRTKHNQQDRYINCAVFSYTTMKINNKATCFNDDDSKCLSVLYLLCLRQGFKHQG